MESAAIRSSTQVNHSTSNSTTKLANPLWNFSQFDFTNLINGILLFIVSLEIDQLLSPAYNKSRTLKLVISMHSNF
jgi:hypothetical protein